ncbi:MAG: ABC transporter permease subunit [Chloroflexi bacterium]|nr:ABC transporter permease subunit [Chloroflexota bacterium]MCC6891622.1 ABC transporter permease subunit [Anaerolineae bacterium]
MDHQVGLKPASRLGASTSVNRPKWTEAILGRDWRVAIPFVAPLVIIMAGLILWPFINAILLSMTVRSVVTRTDQYVGFANYARLLQDSDFITSVGNTLQFTLVSVAVKFVVGMAIALLLNSKLWFRSILTGIMLLPWIVPEVVTALTWRSIYDPIFGGLNPILMQLGLINRPVAWLAEPGLAMASVIAVNVWKGIPFYTILLLAGLKAIEREQYEAAEVDGAGVIQKFRHITLPGLRYVILVTVLLSFISTFNTFGLIYLMTGGGPGGATRMFSILAYEKAIIGLRFGPGIATAFSMAPLMAIIIFILARVMRPEQYSTAKNNETFMDRSLRVFGRGLTRILDLVFLPFEWLAQVLGGLSKSILQPTATSKPRFTRTQRTRMGIGMRLLLLLPMLIFVLFPFYWIFITSFKTDLQIQRFSSIYWPQPWTIEQYRSLIVDTQFLTWFKNTVIVASLSTLVSVFVAALAAYALARLKFTGGRLLTTLLLVTYLLPGSLLFIPLYRILTEIGIINTHAALVVTYPTFLMPFATWVMLGYFRSIPVELEEAALIDGANRLVAFWRITLPLAAPALLSVTLFAFTNAWNEFLFAFVFITSESLKTLPVGLQLLVFGDIYPWGQLMAASLLMAIPVVCVYIYAQRYLVEGITAGSVKG